MSLRPIHRSLPFAAAFAAAAGMPSVGSAQQVDPALRDESIVVFSVLERRQAIGGAPIVNNERRAVSVVDPSPDEVLIANMAGISRGNFGSTSTIVRQSGDGVGNRVERAGAPSSIASERLSGPVLSNRVTGSLRDVGVGIDVDGIPLLRNTTDPQLDAVRVSPVRATVGIDQPVVVAVPGVQGAPDPSRPGGLPIGDGVGGASAAIGATLPRVAGAARPLSSHTGGLGQQISGMLGNVTSRTGGPR
jgi:hypothetical protein